MLVTFLWDNLVVLAWKILDMSEIPREVIEYKLGIDPSFADQAKGKKIHNK
jgi:hypothetical protein